MQSTNQPDQGRPGHHGWKYVECLHLVFGHGGNDLSARWRHLGVNMLLALVVPPAPWLSRRLPAGDVAGGLPREGDVHLEALLT